MAGATLLNPTALREHVETDLSDDALQRILDGEEMDIVRRYGPHSTAVDTVHSISDSDRIYLNRRPSNITSVIDIIDDDEETVDTDYYRAEGRILVRTTGTWAPTVRVTYTPEDENALRVKVLIELCRLNLVHNGLAGERIGDYWTQSVQDYTRERRRLLAQLRRPSLPFA